MAADRLCLIGLGASTPNPSGTSSCHIGRISARKLTYVLSVPSLWLFAASSVLYNLAIKSHADLFCLFSQPNRLSQRSQATTWTAGWPRTRSARRVPCHNGFERYFQCERWPERKEPRGQNPTASAPVHHAIRFCAQPTMVVPPRVFRFTL